MNYHQVKIEDSASIADNATIIGEVTIGKDCLILFNATLRGDIAPITLGDKSNIQENSCLHVDINEPVVVGKNVTVGHNVILHGCTIEDNSLIGMGAIIMNGAHIGKNCLVAAGALVTQGTIVPDGSLVVGSPAKVRRELSAEEIEGNLKAAEEYVEVGKDLVENGIIYSGATLPSDIKTITRGSCEK